MSKTKKRVYRPISKYSINQIDVGVAKGDVEFLRKAAISMAMHGNNWRAAQDFCLHLINYADEVIRGNALLGLSYVARFQGKLDKKLAVPALLRGLTDAKKSVRVRAQDAIEDVNYLLKWRLQQKRAG